MTIWARWRMRWSSGGCTPSPWSGTGRWKGCCFPRTWSGSLLATDLISRKRNGQAHTREELEFLIRGITSGAIPDYQAAAWLMAVSIRGMNADETAWLTQAMASSGETLDLQARWPDVVDKHST